MPALNAIIGANANPMKRELEAVQRMAREAGANIQRSMSGGGHGGSSGALRETMVLMREISRGNISRVPGSLSILLGQLGILKLLTKDNTTAAQTLADAWAEQSQKASLASVAATRKAAASQMAFMADAEEKDATLAQAIADEEGAAKAILHAKATEEKAVASREAAEAELANGEAAAASVGPLGMLLGVVVAIGSAFFIWSKHVEAIADAMAGLKLPDLTPPDISKLSAQEAGWKKIADAIRDAKDNYDSVHESANRYEESLKAQHELEKKLLEIRIKKGQAKSSDMIALEKKQQGEDLAAMVKRRDALQKDSEAKKKQADAMKVPTEKDESAIEGDLKRAAEAAKDHLYGKKGENGEREGGVQDELERYKSYTPTLMGFGRAFWHTPGDLWKYGTQGGDAVRSQLTDQAEGDRAIIAKYDAYQRRRKGNISVRDDQSRLYQTASKEAGEAATLTQKIADQPAINKQKNDAAASLAKADTNGGKSVHGHVSNLQQAGAFTLGASRMTHSHQDTGKVVVHKIEQIVKLLEHTVHHSKETAKNTSGHGGVGDAGNRKF